MAMPATGDAVVGVSAQIDEGSIPPWYSILQRSQTQRLYISVSHSPYSSYNQIFFVKLIIPAPYNTNWGMLPEV